MQVGVPKRLSELIANCRQRPVPSTSAFLTRTYDALYIQIATEQASSRKRLEDNITPLWLVETVLKAVLVDGVTDGNNAAA